jgi:hypothetical protein
VVARSGCADSGAPWLAAGYDFTIKSVAGRCGDWIDWAPDCSYRSRPNLANGSTMHSDPEKSGYLSTNDIVFD